MKDHWYHYLYDAHVVDQIQKTASGHFRLAIWFKMVEKGPTEAINGPSAAVSPLTRAYQ